MYACMYMGFVPEINLFIFIENTKYKKYNIVKHNIIFFKTHTKTHWKWESTNEYKWIWHILIWIKLINDESNLIMGKILDVIYAISTVNLPVLRLLQIVHYHYVTYTTYRKTAR